MKCVVKECQSNMFVVFFLLFFFFFLISENKTLLFPIFPLQCRSIHGLYEKQNFAAVIVCYTRHLSFAHLHDAEELSELNV